MTFYEAAVEVLRRSGRPLHYKKITEIAVREDLLSHVGKTPHLTMSDRLEKELQKDEPTAIDEERPGVFTLDDEHADSVADRIKEKRRRELESKRKQRENRGGDSGEESSSSSRKRSRGSKRDQGPSKRKKNRSDKPNRRERKRTRSPDDDSGDSGERERGRKRTNDTESVEDVDLEDSNRKHLESGPVRLEGIPKAAYRVLSEADQGAMPTDELANRIFDQKLVKFHTHEPVATVRSALANDNQIREDYGHRPLFAYAQGRWSLTEWVLDADVLRREQSVLGLTEEIRQLTTEQLADSLRDVKAEALEHVALTLLERLGYRNIKVSKRSSEGDVFFTADWRQGLADVRACVRVVTDHDRELGSSEVEELRDTLDHYSASEGLIIHLGEAAEDAVQKSRIDGEAPITIFDQETFVELLMKHGIGIKTYRTPIVTIDPEFVDALQE